MTKDEKNMASLNAYMDEKGISPEDRDKLPFGDEKGDQWIDVSDRLPDESGRYWCYVAEQSDLGLGHYQWNYAYSKIDGWERTDGGTITHWMPLPDPPKTA